MFFHTDSPTPPAAAKTADTSTDTARAALPPPARSPDSTPSPPLPGQGRPPAPSPAASAADSRVPAQGAPPSQSPPAHSCARRACRTIPINLAVHDRLKPHHRRRSGAIEIISEPGKKTRESLFNSVGIGIRIPDTIILLFPSPLFVN